MRASTLRRHLLFPYVLALACGGPLPPRDAVEPPPRAPSAPPPAPVAHPPPVRDPDPPPSAPGPGREPRWPALQTELPTWELRLAPADLALLEQNIRVDDYRVPGQLLAAGQAWEVEVEFRGNHTRYLPKRSFRVRFREGDSFEGRKHLELLAAYKDAGYLTEKLWFDFAASTGLRVPRVRYVNLVLNGQVHGVMTEIEGVRKAFLKPHGFDPDADIYRCGMADCELRDVPRRPYQGDWTKRTNEHAPWDDLWGFLSRLNRVPARDFRAFLERELDVDAYLTWLAVDALIANSIVGDSRSFLIHERSSGRWTYVPWDLNNADSLYDRTKLLLQGTGSRVPLMNFSVYDPYAYLLSQERQAQYPGGIAPAWSVLNTRLLDDAVLRGRFIARLEQLLATHFTEAQLFPRIEAAHALLAPYVAEDPWVDRAFDARSVDFLQRFVRERRAYLQANLAALRAHGADPLRIAAVGLDARGAGFVRLVNGGSAPRSLSGLFLTAELRAPMQAPLPALTLAAGGSVTVPAALDGLHPELGLFAADGVTALDTLQAPALQAGEVFEAQDR